MSGQLTRSWTLSSTITGIPSTTVAVDLGLGHAYWIEMTIGKHLTSILAYLMFLNRIFSNRSSIHSTTCQPWEFELVVVAVVVVVVAAGNPLSIFLPLAIGRPGRNSSNMRMLNIDPGRVHPVISAVANDAINGARVTPECVSAKYTLPFARPACIVYGRAIQEDKERWVGELLRESPVVGSWHHAYCCSSRHMAVV